MKLFVAIVLSCVMFSAAMDGCFMKREGSTEIVRHLCKSKPCGWDVYDYATMRLKYYIESMCICPDGFSCKRTDKWDHKDIAYEHHCTPIETTTILETTYLEPTTVESVL